MPSMSQNKYIQVLEKDEDSIEWIESQYSLAEMIYNFNKLNKDEQFFVVSVVKKLAEETGNVFPKT